MSQLECKQRVDSIFKDQGRPRFKQVEIDLKYQSLLQSIYAILSGDLDLLKRSLPHVDFQMVVSLTIVVVQNNRSHLLSCLFEKAPLERVFGLRMDKSIEPLLYAAVLDAPPYYRCGRENSVHTEVMGSIHRSRVLCLFKVLLVS